MRDVASVTAQEVWSARLIRLINDQDGKPTASDVVELAEMDPDQVGPAPTESAPRHLQLVENAPEVVEDAREAPNPDEVLADRFPHAAFALALHQHIARITAERANRLRSWGWDSGRTLDREQSDANFLVFTRGPKGFNVQVKKSGGRARPVYDDRGRRLLVEVRPEAVDLEIVTLADADESLARRVEDTAPTEE